MRRCVLLLVPLLALWPAHADALSIRDIVELARAGLSDDVLLALIDVDPTIFPIDSATLKAVKAAGVSDRVIVAMVRSSRTPPPPLEADDVRAREVPRAPEPQVVVIDHQEPPVVREVPVAYPVYIPVSYAPSPRRPDLRGRTTAPALGDPALRQPLRPGAAAHPGGSHTRPAEPVYWGFGGTLRPDAWKPK
jgi:hypothetical protein